MLLKKLSLCLGAVALSLSTVAMAQQPAPQPTNIAGEVIGKLAMMGHMQFGEFPITQDELNSASQYVMTRAALAGKNITRDQSLVALGYIAGQLSIYIDLQQDSVPSSTAPQSVPAQPMPQTAPQQAPLTMPQPAQQPAPLAAPQAPQQYAPQYVPQVVPQAAPQAAPQTAPQAAPQVAPQVAPQAAPQTAPQAAPQQAPQANSAQQPQVEVIPAPMMGYGPMMGNAPMMDNAPMVLVTPEPGAPSQNAAVQSAPAQSAQQ